MSTRSAFLDRLPAFRGAAAAGATPQSPAVRGCCEGLVADLPEHHRDRLVEGLVRLRRADDLWHWRATLYTAIALAHGETVARARLDRFDACIGR